MKKLQEYNLFKNECLRLQKEWGLMNWQLLFKIEKDPKRYASILTDNKSHKARITFHGTQDEDSDWKETAKHEMIHLVLGRLTELGEERFVREGELIEAEEEIVQWFLKIIK